MIRYEDARRAGERSREVLDLLNYRQSLVRKRTSVVNQLQAFARSKGLARFRLPAVKARKTLVEAAGTVTEELLVNSRLSLCDELTRQINALEARLGEEVDKEEQVKLLHTHPGIGLINALALHHTLGDVRRFAERKKWWRSSGSIRWRKALAKRGGSDRSASTARGSCGTCSVRLLKLAAING